MWETFHALLDRADPGMRMELIDDLYPPRDRSSELLRSFHDVYVRYHDDPVIRDETSDKKLSGPGAGLPHKRIAKRDFIYIHWSRWLKTGITPPQRGASEDEWRTYRDAVRIAVLTNHRDRTKNGVCAPQNHAGSLICCTAILCSAVVGIVASAKHSQATNLLSLAPRRMPT